MKEKSSIFRFLSPFTPAIMSREAYEISPLVLYECPQDNENPQWSAYNAVRLGILADRGVLFQEIGLTSTEVNVNNAITLRKKPEIHYNKIMTLITDPVARLIQDGSKIRNDAYPREVFTEWFSRAMGLQKTIQDSETFTLKTGGEDFLPDSTGIQAAWDSIKLPELTFRSPFPSKIVLSLPYPNE